MAGPNQLRGVELGEVAAWSLLAEKRLTIGAVEAVRLTPCCDPVDCGALPIFRNVTLAGLSMTTTKCDNVGPVWPNVWMSL